jgi:hypothetical protein
MTVTSLLRTSLSVAASLKVPAPCSRAKPVPASNASRARLRDGPGDELGDVGERPVGVGGHRLQPDALADHALRRRGRQLDLFQDRRAEHRREFHRQIEARLQRSATQLRRDDGASGHGQRGGKAGGVDGDRGPVGGAPVDLVIDLGEIEAFGVLRHRPQAQRVA